MLDKVELVRVPVSAAANTLLNVFTAGGWDGVKKRAGVDTLYHTYAIINGKYLYEKTSLPVFKEGTTSSQDSPDKQTTLAPVKNISINEFVKNAIIKTGVPYFKYDAFNSQSCQDFLIASLRANDMSTANTDNFLRQDVKKLIDETPALTKVLAKATTDVDAGIRHAYSELTDKNGGVRIRHRVLDHVGHPHHRFGH
jgi:hypothetical protein